MKRIALALCGLVTACGADDDLTLDALAPSLMDGGYSDAVRETSSSDVSVGALHEAGADAGTDGPDPCANASVPPSTLECAGLYADFASKAIAPNAQAYAPAVPLWSDGATKERWIELPPNTTIDTTNPNEWTFPIGTKVFKQFTYMGKRVETRLFQKTTATFWVHATYAWNADDSATAISYGATVPVGDGGSWVIPTPDDCDECHRGRSDRILGFDQVNLGLAGAQGLTLARLVAFGLVSPAPARTALTIGDDGTGLDGPALGWLHVNCGVTCHNSNENASGYGAGMLLRLDPTTLDGSPALPSWDPLRTTLNVAAISGSVAGLPRILPGDPAHSVIVQLISERGVLQMPPIASRFVDTSDVASIVGWIGAMPGADAGTGAAQDAGSVVDAQEAGEMGDDAAAVTDAASPDATVSTDAATDDGSMLSDAPASLEASSTDAGVPDDAPPETGEIADGGIEGAYGDATSE